MRQASEVLEEVAVQCTMLGYPPELTQAIRAYLVGEGSMAEVADQWQAAQASRGDRSLGFCGYRALYETRGELPTLMQRRLLDIALVTDEVVAYLTCIATSGPVEAMRQALQEREVGDERILDWLSACSWLIVVEDDADEDDADEDDDRGTAAADPKPRARRPSALGRVLLTYLPDRLSEVQRFVRQHSTSGERQLVQLLTLADPPLLDAAWQVAQQVAPGQRGECAAALVAVDAARFASWARSLVVPPGSAGDDEDQHHALEALLDRAPADHRDLALRAAHSELSTGPAWHVNRMRRLALRTLLLLDRATALPELATAMLDDDDTLAGYVVELLGSPQDATERDALRHCVAHGRAGAALAAATALLSATWDGRAELAFALLGHRSKRVRQAGINWLVGQGAAMFERLSGQLDRGTAERRTAALQALYRLDRRHACPLLAQRRQTERSEAVLRAIDDLIGVAPPARGSTVAERLAALVAASRAHLAAGQSPKWLAPEALAKLQWQSGEQVPAEVARYLFARQAHVKGARLDDEVSRALPLLERTGAAEVALVLFHGWREHSAAPGETWLLPLIGALGDDRLVPLLRQQIKTLVKAGRPAVAARLVQTLVLLDTPMALCALDEIGRGMKRGRVRTQARTALAAEARRRGLTLDDLRDEMVPTLGFAADGTLRLSYGLRAFSLRPGMDLSVQIWDARGELLPLLPRATAADDPMHVAAARESWRLLKKSLLVVTATQRARLDAACSKRRSWPSERWQAVFLEHPLLRCLASALIWEMRGAKNGEANARDPLTFRPLPSGECLNAAGEPCRLPPEGDVRLVHPLELPTDALAAWREHLDTFDVAPPFAQLDRATILCPADARVQRQWMPYEGWVLRGSSLRALYEPRGWDPQDPNDDGSEWLWKAFAIGGVEAALQTGYVWPRAERFISVPLLRLVIVPLGSVAHAGEEGTPREVLRGSALSAAVNAHALRLGEVPPVVFSEAACDLAAFAAAGAYTPNWRQETDTWTATEWDDIPF